MLRALFGVFVILHGLVHLWPLVLSQELVEYKPEMGWTGESWFLTGLIGDSATRLVASFAYGLAAIAFTVSGIGLLIGSSWWRPTLAASAVVSAAIILSFWDGGTELLVEKGLVGFLINLGIILSVLVLKWPAE